MSIFSNENASGGITSIDEFPFVPFSTNNKAIEVGGTKLSQSFKLSDEGLRYSFDQNTADMTINHCEKAELFYILKIAQIRRNYPEAFEKFTDINNWENPRNISQNAGPGQGGNIDIKTFEWANFLNKSENSKLKLDYVNNTNLDNYFKVMYQEFGKFIQNQNSDNDDFWNSLTEKTAVSSIISHVKNESIVELEKRSVEKKSLAIKIIMDGEFLPENNENTIIKLCAAFKMDEHSALQALLIKHIGLTKLDNKFNNFGGEDNFTKILTLISGISPIIESTEEEIKTVLSLGKIIKLDNSIFFNSTSNASIKNTNVTFGKDTYVSYPNSGYGGTGTYTSVNQDFLSVPYNKMIFVKFDSDFTFNNISYKKGEIISIPAIIAYAIINDANSEQLQKTSWLVFDGVLFFVGVGEIKVLFEAGKWTQKAFIMADLLGSGSNLLLDAGLDSKLNEISPGLADKFRIWGLLLSVPNGIRALKELIKTKNIISEFEAAKNTLNAQGEVTKEFERSLASMKNKLDQGEELLSLSSFLSKYSPNDVAKIKSVLEEIKDVAQQNKIIQQLESLNDVSLIKKFNADLIESPTLIKTLKNNPETTVVAWNTYTKYNPKFICH